MVWQEDKNHAVIFLQMWRLGGTSVQCRKLCSATNSNTGRLGITLVRWWKGQGNFGTDQNCKRHWHEVAGIELCFIFISSLKWLWVNVLVVWVPCNYEIHSNRKGGKIDSRWEQCCFSLFFFFLKLRTDNHVTGKRKRQIQEQILELQLKKKKNNNLPKKSTWYF